MRFRKLLLLVFLFSGLTAGACEIDNPAFLRRMMFMRYLNDYYSGPLPFQSSVLPVDLFDSSPFQRMSFHHISMLHVPAQTRIGQKTVYQYHLRSDAVFCRMEAHTQRKYGVMIRLRTGGF